MSDSIVSDMQDSFGYSGDEGVTQQSFLGASIRSFETSAGFGSNTSSISINLIADEYHTSDGLGLGLGVDLYHDGIRDKFNPPNVGAPVYFKIGLDPITIEEGWSNTYNEIYGDYFPDQQSFVFGGILQSIDQTKNEGGNPLFSVSISDPREILSNCVLILNKYAGTTYNNKNLFNIFGFLEHDPSDTLKTDLESSAISTNVLTRTATGYTGNDTYEFAPAPFDITRRPTTFPITGRGFARRTEQGMPWYRIQQALKALLNYEGSLPTEYVNAGFGGAIDFRGFKYVVDVSGLPLELIPQMYFVDYDQIDLMSLLQDLCESISHEMLISLVPVLNHPDAQWLWDYNAYQTSQNKTGEVITGIIRIDAIDKSLPPDYGAVQNYLNNLTANGVEISSENLGYDLSNVTTDKFVAGAQEVGMYAFTNNKDRDHLELRKYKHGQPSWLQQKMKDQWLLESSLKQQILPFYGFLGKEAVTIPKGWGPYQQILLDASTLTAFGVGAYYVATEIELRHASVSYQSWKHFLRRLNESWMNDQGDDGWPWAVIPTIGTMSMPPDLGKFDDKEYSVSVPRCVFDSDKPYLDDAGLPKSPCSPPYGYPLYYKRLEHIGMSVGIYNAGVSKGKDREFWVDLKALIEADDADLTKFKEGTVDLTPEQKKRLSEVYVDGWDKLPIIQNIDYKIQSYGSSMASLQKNRERSEYNLRKVYNFVRGVADKHLGKSFLVKMPKKANVDFRVNTLTDANTKEILEGPFGFEPVVTAAITPGITIVPPKVDTPYLSYLDFTDGKSDGALKTNFNPINSQWEYNYTPSQEGGYFSDKTHDQVSSQMLAPKERTNFLDNGRWSCYVRFDHSQALDLSGIGADSFAQEKITANGSIPDVLEELDNVDPDLNVSMNKLQGYTQEAGVPHSVFVKCSVSPKLYMTPKVVERLVSDTSVSPLGNGVKVHARGAAKVPNFGSVTTNNNVTEISPLDILTPVNALGFFGGIDTAENYTTDLSVFEREYDQNSESYIVKTALEDLDEKHVYAIVTLPGKVVPIQSQRFVNAVATASAGLDWVTNQIYGRGVIFGLNGFDKPPPQINHLPHLQDAEKQKVLKRLSVPEHSVNFSAPSPVYPDLVVIPLESTERCYGPWVSSTFTDSTSPPALARNRHSDIGGKIEFSQDEQLAPWNFDGYDLLNEAGTLRAEFSNSLLLFSEKGAFTVPGLPLDMSVGRALIEKGPLVTSINVSVGSEVTTSVQMDMFSASFGKMQQQKEESISKLARDRQKTKDVANSLAKNNAKLKASANDGDRGLITATHRDSINSSLQTGNTVYDVMVSTVVREEEERIKLADVPEKVTAIDYYNSVALQSRGYLDEALTINSDPNSNRALVKNSAGSHLSHMFTPYDELPYNGNMPSVPYVHTQAIQERTS
jgi:hypothetical protein